MTVDEEHIGPTQFFLVMPVAVDHGLRPGAMPGESVNIERAVIGQNDGAGPAHLPNFFVPQTLGAIVVYSAAIIAITDAPTVENRW